MRNIVVVTMVVVLCMFALNAQAAERSGWIKGEKCWVTKKPDGDAKIVGIIKKGAAVTIEPVGGGWAKTVFAPVRNLIEGRKGMEEGKLYNCSDCYIKINNFTDVPPGRW